MTLEAIKQVIDGHFNAGKRALGQLRRAVRDDLPEGAISSDRLSRLCIERLNQGIKSFGGQVERLGKERVRFSATDNAKRLLAVTYGKGLEIAESVQAAIESVQGAWQSGKDEPKFARQTVLRAVYMPAEQGGLPTGKEFDGSAIKPDEVRGERHEFIVLLDDQGTEIPTHITTLAGADTWTEPWFACRELLQNVIDEGGSFETTEDLSVEVVGNSFTLMRIALTGPLWEAWDTRDEWFHARHPEVIYENTNRGLYFHGFLIYHQPEWRFAYDVTEILDRDKLSEDRQLRNADFYDLFNRVLTKCGQLPQSFYELVLDPGQLPQDVAYLADQVYQHIDHGRPDFGGYQMEKMESLFRGKHGPHACWSLNSDQGSQEWFYARQAGFDPAFVSHKLSNLLRYSGVKRASDCLPEIEKRLMPASDIRVDAKDRLKRALRICKRLRPHGSKVVIVNPQFPEERLRAGALAVPSENKVMVLQSFVEASSEDALVKLLVEEFMHLASGEGDCSEGFQSALIAKIADLITPRRRAVALEF